MDPQSSAFVLGLLFGAAKIMTIGTVGFGIGWWRTRARLRALETKQAQPSVSEERLDRLEQGLDYVATQLDRLLQAQVELTEQLAAGGRARAMLPRQVPSVPPAADAAPDTPVTPH